MKRVNSQAMTLMELLIGTLIIMALIAGACFQVSGLLQRARVATAKTTLTGFALCLGMIKDDTGFYPPKASEGPPLTYVKEANPPSPLRSRDWDGPYGKTLSFYDPWGNPYFYELQTIVFGPETISREKGKPYTKTFEFDAAVGEGMLIIENPGTTAGKVTLNGADVVTPDEFKKITPVIIKMVTLKKTDNKLLVELESAPGMTITISISSGSTTKDATFVVGSWGKDGQPGGTKYDQDIVYGTF